MQAIAYAPHVHRATFGALRYAVIDSATRAHCGSYATRTRADAQAAMLAARFPLRRFSVRAEASPR